jgi:hypothetical protein
MSEIRFKVSHEPLDEAEINYVVNRIEAIVCGTGEVIEKTSGSHWGLGTSNDWFLDFNTQTQEFGLSHRYVAGASERMQALRTAIIFVMALEPYNPKAAA